VQDNSRLNLTKNKAEFRVQLPRGLRILPQSTPKFQEIASENVDGSTYLFGYDGKNRNGTIGPLWIEKVEDAAISADAQIVITGILNGKDSHTIKYPVRLIEIPEVPKIESLDVSLSWMVDAIQHNWPNALRDFRKMGFNYIPTFPRAFARDENGNWNA